MGRLVIVWLIAGCWLVALRTEALATGFSASDVRAGKAAFEAADTGDWDSARRIAAEIADPVAAKLLFWSDVVRSGGGAPFAEIVNFVSENPDWPLQRVLRLRAEEAIGDSVPSSLVISWFEGRQPVSTQGRARLGKALMAAGRVEEGRAAIRKAWVNGSFPGSLENEFYATYRHLLTANDHVDRLDQSIWQGRAGDARRMFGRVPEKHRAVAEARLRLRELARNVDGAVAKVPAEMQDHPGFVYERVRWRRVKGRDLAARELLDAYRFDHVNPELWWAERAVLARRALEEGHVSEAYRIARNHALTEGAGFADAEWLAGWIALRFLQEPKEAFDHFTTLFGGVKYPISRSRGAYWAARAAEANMQPDMADLWYRTAAEHPTTYYGQLAAVRLGAGNRLQLPPDPHPSADEADRFAGHELVRAVRMLVAFDQRDRVEPFVLRLEELSDSAGWKALVADLADEQGRPDLALAVAKQATQNGRPLIRRGYPSLYVPEVDLAAARTAEIPLVLAMVRQESAFDVEAVSRVGASGLLQLMPGTARHVAGELGLPYSKQRLTTDPEYNLKIGRAYMSELLESFDGSYVLALAAYNAGPGRARQWQLVNGDPRGNVIDAVDWIESIPFAETRNYVQRTLENLQVYRTMLNNTEVAWSLESDLVR